MHHILKNSSLSLRIAMVSAVIGLAFASVAYGATPWNDNDDASTSVEKVGVYLTDDTGALEMHGGQLSPATVTRVGNEFTSVHRIGIVNKGTLKVTIGLYTAPYAGEGLTVTSTTVKALNGAPVDPSFNTMTGYSSASSFGSRAIIPPYNGTPGSAYYLEPGQSFMYELTMKATLQPGADAQYLSCNGTSTNKYSMKRGMSLFLNGTAGDPVKGEWGIGDTAYTCADASTAGAPPSTTTPATTQPYVNVHEDAHPIGDGNIRPTDPGSQPINANIGPAQHPTDGNTGLDALAYDGKNISEKNVHEDLSSLPHDQPTQLDSGLPTDTPVAQDLTADTSQPVTASQGSSSPTAVNQNGTDADLPAFISQTRIEPTAIKDTTAEYTSSPLVAIPSGTSTSSHTTQTYVMILAFGCALVAAAYAGMRKYMTDAVTPVTQPARTTVSTAVHSVVVEQSVRTSRHLYNNNVNFIGVAPLTTHEQAVEVTREEASEVQRVSVVVDDIITPGASGITVGMSHPVPTKVTHVKLPTPSPISVAGEHAQPRLGRDLLSKFKNLFAHNEVDVFEYAHK